MDVDHSKRHFLRVSRHKEAPIRPPYSGSEDHFVEHCTRCQECVSVCESKVIVIGNSGFPHIDVTHNECTFCELCSDACPTDALDKSQNKAFNTTISIDNRCFASNNIACQSCRDVCDESAIVFDFLSQVIPAPQVSHDACSGCGACVSICPQNSIKLMKKEETCNE